jgi:hypothetical protein
MKNMNPEENPEVLGPELARAYRHIEWLVTRGMGPSTDSWGIRANATQFVQGNLPMRVLMRWPTSPEPKT